MSSSLSKIPPGVQYIFDAEVRMRRWIERQIMEVFAGWSYSEIILPIFDYADLFALGMGKEQAEMTYRFTGRDGKLLALRPEMTSLVARTVATRFREHPRPIRLSYSGEVFRWDEPRGGRQYEFHQIGLEHVGSDRLEADTEALVIAIEALRRLGLEGFTITLSHVDFFNGIAERLNLDEDERRLMREIIDRKETNELDAFLEKYADAGIRSAFCRMAMLAGKREIIHQVRPMVINPKSVAALDDLERVYHIAQEIGIDSYIDIDLGDVGGLDYYTGLTFKIYAPGLGTALGRGGRYDQLLAQFGCPEPAVGFSLCLDWLAQLLAPRVSEITEGDTNEVARLNTDGDIIRAFREANRLRAEGRKVEII
ncbi:MAG TPA: ATP phosphoribosyltransferase regulatory subunit [Blastocatellia bacterium]|nr:ATP phosphoribosyltransferase regulatory subunit [Blastocatellia bacterium]